MALEEFLVDGDVLHRDDTAPGFVLGDRIDEQRGMAITEAVEESGNVSGHG